MAIARERVMTAAEYLAWEERQEIKNEYIDGEIIEMPGATSRHNKIVTRISTAITGLVGLERCEVFGSDMRVRVDATRYVYPDLSVVCGQEHYEDESELSLTNPILVVEVASPSTALYDRIDKFGFYFDVPSIEAYLIIEQDRRRADLCARNTDGWHVRVFDKPGDVVPLEALECELPLADVYRGIEFAKA